MIEHIQQCVTIKKWMEKAITFEAGRTKVEEILLEIKNNEDLHKIVLINEIKEPLGMLSVSKVNFYLSKDKNIKKKMKEEMIQKTLSCRLTDSFFDIAQENLPIPVIDDKGKVCGVFTVKSMLMAYKELSESLTHYTEITDVILNSAYEGIAVVDRDGIIQQMNRTYRNFLGLSPEEEVIGRSVEEVIENTRLHITVQSGVPEKGEIQIIQGQKMIVHRIPIWKDGEVTGAIGMLIFEGVSELYRILGNAGNMQSVPPFEDEERSRTKNQPNLYSFEQILGENGSLMDSKSKARKAAKTKATVMLSGESGTGKELFAQSIHQMSERKGEFVSINCAAIPEHLLEAELFGYEEGAFTGAKKGGHKGKFEAANYGTLFLDEISTMPLPMQAKLLRILEEREVVKIGSHVRVPLHVRVIAATNESLKDLVENKQFRKDLYYRLNVININITPLRERTEDIPLLFGHYVKKFCKENGISVKQIDQHAMECLMNYRWPGNIRELTNIAEQLVVLTEGSMIKESDLPDDIRNSVLPSSSTTEYSLKSKKMLQEKELIEEELEKHEGNKTKTADALGIHRTTLYKKLNEYNLLT
ncbi:sigma-54 interaction domain-containing protein [Alteribacillus bidgolensis]|uniref:Transcriptional regulator n=1 Tax=Alteribacillus bidgolensis TaxID=930129 RepID=A0A1G8LXE9_9BACI|nr:sigma 54-interacting transcriptional regulator [Alteribacillus bidgolensis]SDI60384.1 transcriptional regulator [Alteribacillus bidgolensis]